MLPIREDFPRPTANPRTVTAVEQARDELTEIHREHGVALHRLCRRQLGSDADADDAVQEVLLRAWAALPGFDRARPMWPWLATIARNVCNDVHRRRRTDERRRVPVGGASAAPDEGLLRSDRDAVVREAVTRLPGSAATVLYLRDVEGWDYDRIAEHIDRKPGAARTAVTRARHQLRTHVEEVARARGQWPLSGLFGGWIARRRLRARNAAAEAAGTLGPRLDATADLGGLLAHHGAQVAASAFLLLGTLVGGFGADPPAAPAPVTALIDEAEADRAAPHRGGAPGDTRPVAQTTDALTPDPAAPAPPGGVGLPDAGNDVAMALPAPQIEPELAEDPLPTGVALPAPATPVPSAVAIAVPDLPVPPLP